MKMPRVAAGLVAFAIVGALISTIIRAPGSVYSLLWIVVVLVLYSLLLPRLLEYFFNWIEIGGQSYFLEVHHQRGAPCVALVAVWPSFWSKSLVVRGVSFEIVSINGEAQLRIQGRWNSNEVNSRSDGSGGRFLYYFYSGFQDGKSRPAVKVPNGMTFMNIDYSGNGSGFFVDKMDESTTITRNDMNLVKLSHLHCQQFGLGKAKFGLVKADGFSDENFERIRNCVSAAFGSRDKLVSLVGSVAAEKLEAAVASAHRLAAVDQSLDHDVDEIRSELKKRVSLCDARYSSFRVVSCLVNRDGRRFFGVNMENSSYPAGICAESAAVAQMVSSVGSAKAGIACIYLYSPDSKDGLFPCGVCLQRLSMYASPEAGVVIFSDETVSWRGKFCQLIGHRFHLETP
jgi:cytidine deaminase